MKKFSFSLDSVLDYKSQNLDILRNEHGKILLRMRQQEAAIERLEIDYAGVNNVFNEKKANGITIVEASSYELYLRKLEAQIKYEKNRLLEIEREEERKRNEVLEAKKETSSLELLKEKKLEQYNKDIQKQEELFIEEFVANTRATV